MKNKLFDLTGSDCLPSLLQCLLQGVNSIRKSGNSFKFVVQPGLESVASGSQNTTDDCSNVPHGEDSLYLQTNTEKM